MTRIHVSPSAATSMTLKHPETVCVVFRVASKAELGERHEVTWKYDDCFSIVMIHIKALISGTVK